MVWRESLAKNVQIRKRSALASDVNFAGKEY